MSSDDFRRDFTGIIPEPPGGTAGEVANEAWQMAYVARATAIRAEQKVAATIDGHLKLFEEYGSLQANIARYFSQVNSRFDDLEKRLDARVTAASANADEARTSSHDLQDELEKMEVILKNVKEHTVDSVRVKTLIDDSVETIVSKKRLAELESAASDALKNRKDFKILTISGIVVTLIGVLATYYVTKATTPSLPATVDTSVSAPHH